MQLFAWLDNSVRLVRFTIHNWRKDVFLGQIGNGKSYLLTPGFDQWRYFSTSMDILNWTWSSTSKTSMFRNIYAISLVLKLRDCFSKARLYKYTDRLSWKSLRAGSPWLEKGWFPNIELSSWRDLWALLNRNRESKRDDNVDTLVGGKAL